MLRQQLIQAVLMLIGAAGCLSFRQSSGVPQSSKNVPLTLARSLPGIYANGSGYGGAQITLDQDGRFVWEAFTDTGFHQTTRGTYKVSKVTLILQPTHTEATQEGEDSTKPEAIPLRYFCILWGERLYLVETDQIQKFCEAVNVGLEPRVWHGRYLLRAGDKGKEVKGKPEVPKPWSDFVLARPVVARVRKITHTSRKQPANGKLRGETMTVTVNAGSRQGLKPGMKLLLYDPTLYMRDPVTPGEIAIVRRVNAQSAVAEFKSDSEEVKRNWIATTREVTAEKRFRNDLQQWKLAELRRKKER
jgi:hypothetical protein